MEKWTKENIIAAFLLVASANISGVANIVSPSVRADAFTSLDAAKGRAEIIAMFEEFKDEVHKDIITLQVNQLTCLRAIESGK